jgi:hypothetical protein
MRYNLTIIYIHLKNMIQKFVFIALIAISTAASAQNSLGIRAGVNLANFRDDNDNSASGNITGYTAALFYKITTATQLVFKPEISVSTQGGAVKLNNIKSTTKTAYAAASAILSSEGGDKKLFFEGGIQIGTLVNAKQEITGISKDIKDSLKTMNMDIVLGVGYKITGNFFAEARYGYGLTDVSKSKTDKSYNNVLQVTLAYSFNARRKK